VEIGGGGATVCAKKKKCIRKKEKWGKGREGSIVRS
jgi:hypothetical protein